MTCCIPVMWSFSSRHHGMVTCMWGSDATYLEYKHRKPMFPQEERLFMVKNIKAVKDAYINEGSGVIDFLPTLNKVKPDVFVVNAEGGSDVVYLPLPVR